MAVEVRELTVTDAAGLIDCFERCYGKSYANELFYDRRLLESAIGEGQLRSVVAVDDGVLVGHTGLTIRHPTALVPEAGNTVVDPAMRGRGLLGELGGALRELAIRDGFVGYIHYPTTAHEIMQKAATSGAGRETGIMLDYVPAETEYRDIDQPGGRIAATIVYQPLAAAPAAKIFAPKRYQRLIGSLAGSLELDRGFLASDTPLEPGGDVTVRTHAKRGVNHISVTASGEDVVPAVNDVEAAPLTMIDLPMDTSGLDIMVERLVLDGFRYCGWLPGFAGCDVLRLQKLDFEAVDKPLLITEEAEALFQFILQDY